ncbi:vitamin K epoxide reductase family protein [Mycetocola sp. 2940]|uniref:vitamin K epoxide reductase family protein n=1 Tax=Mycetocola sp. 2940 TaxID=3156452 RepID=UPI0033955317
MSSHENPSRPVGFAVFLVVAGVVGWIAAFALTLEKFASLASPGAALSCDVSVLVQCSANLDSPQGSVFGFPNPILGLTGWVAPVVVGVAVLAGARFDRWFWLAFQLGVTAAFAFVVWLISQSIFVLGTLCPWCIVTWAVTIPVFWVVTLGNLASGILPSPRGVRRVAVVLSGWIVVLTLACYVVIAVLAQLRLDVLGSL